MRFFLQQPHQYLLINMQNRAPLLREPGANSLNPLLWVPTLSAWEGFGSLTVVAVMSLRRSGISDLLGLLALLTIGLEGGRLWLPITLQLALREGIRPSRSSRSPVLVGLRLGCMTGMEGPPLLWRTAGAQTDRDSYKEYSVNYLYKE